jgi:hypothetical protein
MAERKENSVLFSLRELKNIETDRVKEEEDAKKAADEAARLAREADERQKRDDAERRRREAEEAEHRRHAEVERQKREEQLRLDEAERRARIDAQARLEEQRLKMEIEAAAQTKKPTGLIAVASLLGILVIGLGVFAYMRHQKGEEERRKALMAQADAEASKKREAELQRELDELQAESDRLDTEYKKTLAEMASADEAKKKDLEKRLADLDKQREVNKAKMQNTKDKGKGGTKPNTGPQIKLCPPGQPIC